MIIHTDNIMGTAYLIVRLSPVFYTEIISRTAYADIGIKQLRSLFCRRLHVLVDFLDDVINS